MQGGTVLVLVGVPGSGKTALASWLSEQGNVIVISRDTLKRALFGPHDVGSAQNHLAFEVMKLAMPLSLSLADLVVLDGMPFSRVGQVEEVHAIAMSAGASCLPLFFECPVDVAQDRLRTPDPSGPPDRDPDLVTRVTESFRRIPQSWGRVNSAQSLQGVRDDVRMYLKTNGVDL
jgi:predicted kinase